MGRVRTGIVIVLTAILVYLIWSGSGCVSEDDMIVEKFRTPHEVIEESSLPEGTRRIDAHIVYGNGAKSEFNFSGIPGPEHARSDFRFDVRRDGEVVTTWEEEPTLHG